MSKPTKIRIVEDPSRRIGDPSHNAFVERGTNLHRRTAVAPDSMLMPFSPEVAEARISKIALVEKALRKALGKPFFAANGFFLYEGDCLDYLPRLQDQNIELDLTVTSPPYNIGKEYETVREVEDYVDWCDKWMSDIHRVTKNEGSFWLNLGYLPVPNQGLCVPIPYLLWNRSPFYLVQEVVWEYGAGVSAKARLSPRNEKWLYYVSDPENYTFNLDDIRDPNVKYPNQKRNGKFRCNPLGKNPSDVWHFPKVTTGAQRSSKERSAHPAQFPLPVVERIILASSNPADLVLDPFSGSASSGVAAVGLGRVFVGFETRQDYCKASVERFEHFWRERENVLEQRPLF